MGRPKQLLDVNGAPMLQLVVEQACASSLDDVVVVLGADAAPIRNAVRFGRARVVVNDRHADGMSTSLRAGLDSLGGAVDDAVVLLADRPDVDASLIDSLLGLHARSRLPAAATSVGGVLQPPVVLSRRLWPAVTQLRGDAGLRDVLRSRPADVATLPVAPAVDVDTPDDYARLLARLRAKPATSDGGR